MTPEEAKKLAREKLIEKEPSLATAFRVQDVEERVDIIENGAKEIEKKVEEVSKQEGPKGERGEKGDQGDSGYTPVKGVDYFDGRDGIDGKDGKDGVGVSGKDGVDGLPGKNGSPDTPEQIVGKLNTLEEAVDYKVLKNTPTVRDIILEIKKLPENERLDISDIRNWNQPGKGKQDLRWHGSGLTFGSSPMVQYAVVIGGTNNQLAQVSGLGTSGQVLTSNGTGSSPTWQDVVGGVTDVTATSPITSSGGATPNISTSMATNKLIGRGTSGTGVMEEITLGTNISLSGTTLNVPTGAGGVASITGTANQVIASASTGAITLSLPQSIATTSSPTFGGISVDGAAVFNNSGGNFNFRVKGDTEPDLLWTDADGDGGNGQVIIGRSTANSFTRFTVIAADGRIGGYIAGHSDTGLVVARINNAGEIFRVEASGTTQFYVNNSTGYFGADNLDFKTSRTTGALGVGGIGALIAGKHISGNAASVGAFAAVYQFIGLDNVIGAQISGEYTELSGGSTLGMSLDFHIYASSTLTKAMQLYQTGNLGVGVTGTSIAARIHALSTTEQLRLGYDASNYLSLTVGSTGGVTLNAVGSGANFYLSDKLTVNGGSQLGSSFLTVTGDHGDWSGDTGQLIISGATNTNKRLHMGFDTTGDYGFIRASEAGTSVRPLIINPDDKVTIGKSSTPTYTLDVGGDVNTDGVFRVGGTGGVTGTFLDQGGNTITVTGGIITALS